MNIKNMTATEMANCVNEMMEQVAFHAKEPIDNYCGLMEAAFNLYGFLHYDAGCQWKENELPKERCEPFEF